MTLHSVGGMIGMFVQLFAVYVVAHVVAQIWVYGFTPDLVSSIIDRVK